MSDARRKLAALERLADLADLAFARDRAGFMRVQARRNKLRGDAEKIRASESALMRLAATEPETAANLFVERARGEAVRDRLRGEIRSLAGEEEETRALAISAFRRRRAVAFLETRATVAVRREDARKEAAALSALAALKRNKL